MLQKKLIAEYKDPFEKQLAGIIIENISTDLYCRKYLTHLLQHAKYYISIYADVLDKLLQHSSKSKETISLIDFGAGNGLLGIFAKFCGFKKVFLNDINATFMQASEQLAAQLEISLEGYVTGDIEAVQAYFETDAPDAIVGTDVIEHIYNLETFFECLRQINPSIASVFTTASNPRNFFKARSLQKLQLRDELFGGTPEDDILFGDSPLAPFLKIREQIIRKQGGELNDKSIAELAKVSRGLIEKDIVKVVDHYKMSGKLPAAITHRTNTCNPLTGSWTERILSLNTYTLLYNSAGFTLTFYNGLFNDYHPGFTRYIKKALNAAIAIFGNSISPYIILVGIKQVHM